MFLPIALILVLQFAFATKQNTSTPEAIVETCFEFLKSHEVVGDRWDHHYHFYRPGLTKYSASQWLWDSGSHMIVWSHRNVANAIADLRSLLSFQHENGRIPEITNWRIEKWQEPLQLALWSSYKFVDLTQMPVLPFSLRAIWWATNDTALLRELVPPLVEYFVWWSTTRDIDHDGLVTIIHSWESGLDASPAYDLAYKVTNPKPSFYDLYPKFEELVIDYKLRYGWDQDAIVTRKKEPFHLIDGYFLVQDVAVNSVLSRGWGVLAELAMATSDPETAEFCKSEQKKVEAAIVKHMWDPGLKRFVTLWHDKNGKRQKAPVETVQTLFPLILEGLPVEIQQSIVKTQLMNESKFWRPFPIPTVAADAPQYEPVFTVDLMWRGPTWGITNWFVMEGLLTHGFRKEAEQLLDRWTSLCEKSGIWEDYNPETGAPYGVEGLGMSTLIVDFLYRLGRVH